MHRRKHTGELLKCEHCDFTTWKNTRLTEHRATHKEHKPFHCSKCPKRFAAAYILREHERRHGNVSTQCTQCDYMATIPAALTRHIQQCHAATSQE
ncbi:hypothetical protein AAVH_33818 [Aphelenchoides avenae]|nr:hypothetical protein AAVH_33818 [Aphelenchus avenae]